jgi:hypothetical protein
LSDIAGAFCPGGLSGFTMNGWPSGGWTWIHPPAAADTFESP